MNQLVEELKITPDTIQLLAGKADEPEWLRSMRLRAWAIYEAYDHPNPNLNVIPGLDLRSQRLIETPAGNRDLSLDAPSQIPLVKHRAAIMTLENGVRTSYKADPLLSSQGVILTDMRTALSRYGVIIEKNFRKNGIELNAGKFAALNAALWQNGTFLFVPKNVKLTAPLQAVTSLKTENSALFTYSMVIVEEGAEVEFVDTYTSTRNATGYLNAVVEVFANPNSNFLYLSNQDLAPSVIHSAYKRAMAERDARLRWIEIGWGSRFSRNNIEAVLEQPGASAELLGLYFASEQQYLEFDTVQIHAAPFCTSDLLYKGALKGDSRTRFEGLIRVSKGSQKTNAYQANRNLILGGNAHADSVPKLEIEANDVRCTHGATVGPINREDLFYLMSRGLSRETATKLLVLGFYTEVIDRIPVADIREELVQYIETHIF